MAKVIEISNHELETRRELSCVNMLQLCKAQISRAAGLISQIVSIKQCSVATLYLKLASRPDSARVFRDFLGEFVFYFIL